MENETLDEALERIEKHLILKTLKKTAYSQTHTAELLGIKRTTLRYKLEKYGLLNKITDVEE